MNRISRSSKWLVAVAAVLFLAGGLGFASNMGFKFNAPFVPPGVLGAPTGDNWTSFPFNNPYTQAEDVCLQLGLTPGVATVAHRTNTFSFQTYLCGNPGSPSNFTLTKCQGLKIVDSRTSGSGVIVGSHDPIFSCDLSAQGTAPVGDNWVSVPYHTTAVTHQDLCDDVGPNVITVATLQNPATGTLNTYLCSQAGGSPAAPSNKALILGQAAKVVVGANTSWVPSHF